MPMVIKASQWSPLLIQLDKEHRLAIHTMVENGAVIETIPPLQITATLVPDDGINAVLRNNTTEQTPTESENQLPDIVSISTRTDKSEGKKIADNKSTDDSTTIEGGSDTATDTADQNETSEVNDTTVEQTTFGHTNKQDTSVTA